VCASEVGDHDTLKRLLAYADRFLQPSWKDGGYFYPRRDEALDAAGLPIAMDPHTGNALISYARLNVPHGLRKLYDDPWAATAHFKEPALVEMSPALDIRSAWFDDDRSRLTLRLGSLSGQAVVATLSIGNLWNRGSWKFEIDGVPVASGNAREVTSHTGINLRREGDTLLVELPIKRFLTITVEWNGTTKHQTR
jgi:hypothetical protein